MILLIISISFIMLMCYIIGCCWWLYNIL